MLAQLDESLHPAVQPPEQDACSAEIVVRLHEHHGQVAVREGLGISVLPRWLVAADVAEGRLVRVLAEVDVGAVPIVATYPARRRLRRPAKLVLDRLASKLEQRVSA